MSDPKARLYESCSKRLHGHGVSTIKDSLLEMLNFVDPHLKPDQYGSGEAIERFEEKLARCLGKEAAVFFPSGTMAQQIGLRYWADRSGRPAIAMHRTCHLDVHEEDGYRLLHGLEGVPLGELLRPLSRRDIEGADARIGSVVVELPQRHSGGVLPKWSELVAMREWCDANGAAMHMDGARIWETQDFYSKTPAQISELFDSVYVSFYKGLGAVGGAILAGPASMVEAAKVWKRRHGGDLYRLFPIFISADYGFETRLRRMPEYMARAREIAKIIQRQSELTLQPREIHTNMMHLAFKKSVAEVEDALYNAALESGVYIAKSLWTRSFAPEPILELYIGDAATRVEIDEIERAFSCLNAALR